MNYEKMQQLKKKFQKSSSTKNSFSVNTKIPENPHNSSKKVGEEIFKI